MILKKLKRETILNIIKTIIMKIIQAVLETLYNAKYFSHHVLIRGYLCNHFISMFWSKMTLAAKKKNNKNNR